MTEFETHMPVHKHEPIQHRDGKPPWCNVCGLTANRLIPQSKLSNVKPNISPDASQILMYFEYQHLDLKKASVCRPFFVLAWQLENDLLDGPKKVEALQALLEARRLSLIAIFGSDGEAG